jgi:hypothetical protein
MQRIGAIYIFVNNAGSVPSMQFTEVDDALCIRCWRESCSATSG